MNFKRQKKPKSSLLSSNISGAFDFSSQLRFNYKNDKNFKSIFSYHSSDIEEDTAEMEDNNKLMIALFSLLLIMFFPVLGWFSLKNVSKNQKLVVYRCGKLWKIFDSGLRVTIPFIDSCKYIDTKMKECNILNASCATKDQGLIELDCTVKYSVADPRYLINNVRDWEDHVAKEIRMSLTESIKFFRWSDFGGRRPACYDIEIQIKKYLLSNESTKGLEINDIVLHNIKQCKEPETPIDALKKINFKDLGRHISAMTPMLFSVPAMDKTTDASSDNPSVINSAGDNNEPMIKNEAVEEFFEKLELVKNLALQQQLQNNIVSGSIFNLANSTNQQPCTSDLSTDSSNTNKVCAGDTNGIKMMFVNLVKEFVKRNFTLALAQTAIQTNSLQKLFEDTEKVESVSKQVAELVKMCQLDGFVLFVVNKYFNEPCYFHWSPVSGLLQSGKVDDYSLLINLDQYI